MGVGGTADVDFASGRNGIERVAEQDDEECLDLIAFGEDFAGAGGEIGRDLRLARDEGGGHESEDGFDERHDGLRFLLERGTTREVEEAADELLAKADSGLELLQVGG